MDPNYSLEEIVKKCDYDTKLAITQWVFKHIVDHAEDGGSYRYLIYERLGFSTDAYAPLLDDGMTISNEFDLNLKERLVDALKRNDIPALKSSLSLCDKEGCFEHATAGIPTKEKYLWLCSKHSEGLIAK